MMSRTDQILITPDQTEILTFLTRWLFCPFEITHSKNSAFHLPIENLKWQYDVHNVFVVEKQTETWLYRAWHPQYMKKSEPEFPFNSHLMQSHV